MNIFEAEKLEAAAKHLPKAVQTKLHILVDESAAAHAGMLHVSDLAREAYDAWQQAETNNARSHTFASVTGPLLEQRGIFHTEPGDDGRPVYESRDEHWTKTNGATLVRAWEAWQRSKVNLPYLKKRWEAYAFLSDLIHWLPDNRRHSKHVPVKIKGADHIAAVEKLRSQIADIDAKYTDAELAPCTAADLIARAEREVDRLASRGEIRFDARIRDGSPINLDWPEQAVTVANGMQAEKLVWLFRDEIKAKLATKIRAETPADTLSDFDRAAELSALEADKVKLEREEEAHIVAAAETGQFIDRRRDANPAAILELSV